jgi:hypothetical protein
MQCSAIIGLGSLRVPVRWKQSPCHCCELLTSSETSLSNLSYTCDLKIWRDLDKKRHDGQLNPQIASSPSKIYAKLRFGPTESIILEGWKMPAVDPTEKSIY